MRKKYIVCFFMCLVLYFAYSSFALGERIPLPFTDCTLYEKESPADYPYILVNGDTIHILMEKRILKMNDDPLVDVFWARVEGACYQFVNGSFIPCEQHCETILNGVDRAGVQNADGTEDTKTVGTDESERYPRTGEGALVIIQSTENTTYAVFNRSEVYRWTPDEEKPWQFVISLDFTMEQDQVDWYFCEFLIHEDTLYYASNFHYYLPEFRDPQGSEHSTIYEYNLNTGEKRVVCTVGRTYSLDWGYDNQLIVSLALTPYGYGSFYWLDCATGQYEKADFPFGADASKLFLDGKDGWYYIASEYACHYRKNGTHTKLVAVPEEILGSPTGVMNTAHNEIITINYQNLLRVSLIDGEKLSLVGRTTDFSTMSQTVPDYVPFLNEHGDMTIAKLDYPSSYTEIAQQLVLGNQDFDMMLLSVSDSHLSSMVRKGYYHDLSAVPAVKRYIDSLLPAFREECVDGETIVAVPLAVQDRVMMVNRELWEELELGDYPTTLGELLDIIDQCFRDGILDEYRLFADDGGRTTAYDRLSSHVIMQYIASSDRQGKTLRFNTPEMRSLLMKLDALRDRLKEHQRRNLTGEALLRSEGQLAMVTGRPSYQREDYDVLLLGIEGTEDIAVPVYLTVMVVNPHSAQSELAEALLDYIVSNPTALMRCVFTTEQPDGILADEQSLTEEEYNRQKTEWEQILSAAKREGDMDGMERAEDQLSYLEDNYKWNYKVTPEAAAAYYGIAPHLQVLKEETYGFIIKNAANIISSFDHGRMDVEQMVKKIDQQLDMQKMEGQ